jgi:hypothetical protein
MYQQIIMNQNDLNQQVSWCTQNLGPGGIVHSVTQAELYRWSHEIIGFGMHQLHFRDETDYLVYVLRWK